MEPYCLEKKAAMLCTASVEEVIEDHYQNQIKKLADDEKDLTNREREQKVISEAKAQGRNIERV